LQTNQNGLSPYDWLTTWLLSFASITNITIYYFYFLIPQVV